MKVYRMVGGEQYGALDAVTSLLEDLLSPCADLVHGLDPVLLHLKLAGLEARFSFVRPIEIEAIKRGPKTAQIPFGGLIATIGSIDNPRNSQVSRPLYGLD